MQAIQKEIIEEFSMFEDWMDKYQYIIDMGNEAPELPPDEKTDEHLINGCQSRVWLAPQYKDGKLYFTADSDAVITKGLAALLIRVFNGRTPDEILNNELFFIDETGLAAHLSPTRSNGLLAMVKQIKLYAMAYQAKEKKDKQ